MKGTSGQLLRIVRIALAERHYWFLVTITVSKRHSWSSETPSDPQLAKRTTIRSTTSPAYRHQINIWPSVPPSDLRLVQRTTIRSTTGPAYHHQIHNWSMAPAGGITQGNQWSVLPSQRNKSCVCGGCNNQLTSTNVSNLTCRDALRFWAHLSQTLQCL